VSIENRFAPLPSELRRRRLLAESEASQGVAWRDDCPPEVGRKIHATLLHVTNAVGRVLAAADSHRLISSASGSADLSAYEVLVEGEGDDAERLDVVAAVVLAFAWLSEHDTELVNVSDEWTSRPTEVPRYDLTIFAETVNDLLLGARVEWNYEDGKFASRGNLVLHAEVVRPVTILLDSDPRFAKASAGLQTALTRLAENKPDVAITDAASAVQEFFRALGVSGNSIADQLNNAQKVNILTAADRQLLKPITDWINADRSERGNAHHHRDGDVSRADGWLAIHVVAALMVRLSNEDPREITAARARRDAEAARRSAEAEAIVAAQAETEVNGMRMSRYSEDTPF